MTMYSCPFCGKEVSKEEVLFVDDSFSQTYEDRRRYDFLRSCYENYPLPDGMNFRGLYHHAKEEVVCFRDSKGFPTVLQVRASDGLSPRELERERDARIDAEPGSLKEEVKPDQSTLEKRMAFRACPHCHCRLPNDFGVCQTINVTLLGGRAAGKTVYLIALLQQLQNQLTLNNLGTVQLLPESALFMQDQVQYYIDHKGVAMPTPPGQRLFPLVFLYTYMQHKVFIAIYDIAGEGIIDANNQVNADYLVNHKGIEKAHAVWLMLDPNQLNDGAYSNAADAQSPSEGQDHEKFTTSVSVFLANAVMGTSNLGILQQVEHVITVMTKLDRPLMCEPELFAGNVVIRDDIGQSHRDRVDVVTLRQVDREVNHFISHKLGTDAKKLIQSAFKKGGRTPSVSMLAVSAYSRQQIDAKINFLNIYDEKASKHRIIEPFLALLVLEKAVPATQDEPADAEAGRKSKPRCGLRGKRQAV